MRAYHPDISTAHERATQEDPWIMYLVVRKDWQGSKDALLESAARAAVQAEAQWGEEYQDAFDAWWEQSFRKVTLRAKEGQWDKLVEEVPSTISGPVAACVPVLRSQRPKLLSKLQTLQELPLSESGENDSPAGINFYLLEDMSLGKQVAQIAHASMKFAVQNQIEFKEVGLLGMNVKHVDNLESYRTDDATEIQDAGLTEVQSGTLTVVASAKQPVPAG